MKSKKKSDTCEVRTHAGYPTGLAGQRLNHSAKLSTCTFRDIYLAYKVKEINFSGLVKKIENMKCVCIYREVKPQKINEINT